MKQEYKYTDIETEKTYEGFLYSENEIESIFPTQVKEKLLDTEGTDELLEEFFRELNDLKATDFDDTFLVNILKLDDIILNHKSWRIGEAFAEYHIETNSNARFYYNELRDTRNVFGNKTGADLVGFIKIEDEIVFLFGEVKTSGDKHVPPNVLYSRRNRTGKLEKGMIDQLKDLANNTNVTKQLIRNMGFKVKDLEKDNPFRRDYFEALNNFYFNKFHLIGILVRDTIPNEQDLRARFNNLTKNVKKEVGLNLTALYVPVEIDKWNNLMV